MSTLYIDNNAVAELKGLTNSVTGAIDTGATVNVTILDQSGTAVSGATWPVAMAHASGGTYRATLSSSLALIHGRKYTALVNATGSGGEVGEWNCPVIALDRACS
jgi:hypothetical protein